MSRWWRAYDEAVDDPKLIALTDEQFRFWFNILCVCSAFGGSLPEVRTVSIKLRMQPRKVIRLLNDLQSAGLLDEANGLIFPHNWEMRQYKSDVSTGRVKRFRERKRNVSRNVSETSPEYRVQSTETESKKDIVPAPDGADGWPRDFREQFWNAYPRHVGKKAAFRKLEAVRKAGECSFAKLIQAIGSIDASDPKYIPHPTTWLNQGRYLDAEATGPPDWVAEATERVRREREAAKNGKARQVQENPANGSRSCGTDHARELLSEGAALHRSHSEPARSPSDDRTEH